MELRKQARTPLFCSCRLVLSIISCLGFVNLYILRFNLPLTMTCMINHTASLQLTINESGVTQLKTPSFRSESCNEITPAHGKYTKKVKRPDTVSYSNGTIVWSATMQILVLSSFLLGYLITQVPGGWLSERLGGKMFFGWSIFACGIVTLFIPLAAVTDYRAVMGIRFFVGLCQGMVWPAMHVVWSRWAPPLERQKLTSLCYAGSGLGIVITYPSSALLCENGRWSSMFYISGSLGILWFFAWSYLVYDTPEIHPNISAEEKAYICYSLKKYIPMTIQRHQDTPWKQMFTSSAVWGVIITHICARFAFYSLLSTSSRYLYDIHYFHYYQIAVITALAYIGLFIGTVVSGTLYDAVLTKKLCTRTSARKFGNTIGMLIPGILVLIVGFINCTYREVVAVIIITCGTVGGITYGAGFLTNFSDIAPQHTGILFGFANALSTMLYIMIPPTISYMTADHTQSQWQKVFILTAGFCFLGVLVFVAFGSGNVQDWARLKRVHDASTDTSTLTSVSQSENVKANEEESFQVIVRSISSSGDPSFQVGVPVRSISSSVDPTSDMYSSKKLQERGPERPFRLKLLA